MNYLHRMLAALTGAYTDEDVGNALFNRPLKTNIGKLFSIHGFGMQIVSDHSDRVKAWDNIDFAEGAVLDRYGANLGVRRDGASDEFYRLLIQVKMLSQLSGGDIDTVINAAATMLKVRPDEIDLMEVFPAKVWIMVDADRIDAESMRLIYAIWRMIKRILAAGIGFKLYLVFYRQGLQDAYIGMAGVLEPLLEGGLPLIPIEGDQYLLVRMPGLIEQRITGRSA